MLNTENISHWNKALDVNGNAIAKVFYKDGSTEMLGNGRTSDLKIALGNSSYKKFYKSRSGLRNSK